MASKHRRKPYLEAGGSPKRVAPFSSRRKWQPWWVAAGAAVCIVVVALYFRALHGKFVLDDQVQVTENPYLASGQIWRSLFTKDYFIQSGEIGYRPILTASYAVERLFWSCWGNPQWGYHLTNILLHLANAILVMWLASRLFPGVVLPALAACVFAIHPVNSEVVAVVTFRDDSLSLVFLLAGLALYVKGRRDGRPWRWNTVAAVLFLLAALVKEQAAVFPLCVLLWWAAFERSRSGQTAPHGARAAVLPIIVAAAVFALARVEMSGYQESVAAIDQMGFVARLVAAPRTLVHYVRMLVFPVRQSSYYPALNWQREALGWMNGLSWLAVLAMMVLTGLGLRRWPVLGFCGGWFLVMAIPVSNLAAINNFAAYDRYLYATTAAFGFGVAASARRAYELLADKRQRLSLISVLALWAVIMASRTVQRVEVWRDGFSFWTNALLIAPNMRYIRNGYATGLNRLNRFDDARKQFEKAVELAERDHRGLPKAADSLVGLGVYYANVGQLDQAAEYYNQSLKIDQKNDVALRGLAEVFQKRGQWFQAVEQYERFLHFYPDDPEVINNLADLYVNDPLKARSSAHAAIRLATRACDLTRWGRWEMILTLAEAYFAAGQRSEAIAHGQRALRLSPGNRDILEKLRHFGSP